MNIRGIALTIVRADTGTFHAEVKVNLQISSNHIIDEVSIRKIMAQALRSAQKKKARSIAFCGFGRKKGTIKPIHAAKIMAQEVWRYARETKHPAIHKIFFSVEDQPTFKIFNNCVYSYLDHVINVLCGGPFVTVDALIEYQGGIVLIERSNPPFGWALPGGFLDYGESAEDAVAREVKEETNLEFVEYRQFHTYSAYGRDPRFQTVTIVFFGKGVGALQSGDDAQNAHVFAFDRLPERMAFDHRDIIARYNEMKNKGVCRYE